MSESQVATPQQVVATFWRLTSNYRQRFGKILDMGAGDCRFAYGGNFDKYIGVEIDKNRALASKPPQNGKLIQGCVFRHKGTSYDACIGNPPYVRHHDIERPWKDRTATRLGNEIGIALNKHCNLYLYFLCLGLVKTKRDGLLALIIPYEWVSRPSAKALRQYICDAKWNVDVYRFRMQIFKDVLTTASISIIDKRGREGRWAYHDILPDHKVVSRKGIVDTEQGILGYSERGDVWALRGLSPGSQRVFTLTESERLDAGLSMWDVEPCVTTLKDFPRDLSVLSKATFEKHFIDAGKRCWLIKSYSHSKRASLRAYLDAVPKAKRSTWTCLNQTPWFNFKPHPVPQLLISSGFTKFGPKVVLNAFAVQAVGSVYGIHSKSKLPVRRLQTHLRMFDFEKRLVAHAKTLKKIEIKQLNGVLKQCAATL